MSVQAGFDEGHERQKANIHQDERTCNANRQQCYDKASGRTQFRLHCSTVE